MRRKGGGSSQSTRFVKGFRALIVEATWTAKAALKIYFRYSAWLVSDVIATPAWLVLLLFPALMFLPRDQWSNPTVLNMFFWAMILWDIVSAGLWGFGMAIRREQQTGTLEYILLTNANRAVLFSRFLASRIVSLGLTLAYTYVFFVLLFNTSVIAHDVALVAAVLLVGLFTSMGFGLVYGSLVLKFKNVGPLNNILQFVLLGLSGIFFPVSSLPSPVQLVSLLIPFTYVSELLRYHAMRYPTLLPVSLEWCILLVMTVLLDLAGVTLIRVVEHRLKRTGELAHY
ncbi:ABC transporter permease [Infirmifilum lucidum]|uniref:ABC transporter permease n=1 Tax=Infirmifilum lucidum TaxID=2776706 RepID=A0A7L9FIJ1_9CREN|nr:ABC transporter permease [Infirmifilum lucidum]QOJ78744.1 ABC transporter permease [Infirmifilum lucidum]